MFSWCFDDNRLQLFSYLKGESFLELQEDCLSLPHITVQGQKFILMSVKIKDSQILNILMKVSKFEKHNLTECKIIQ
jgi:hypothetical protein